MFKLRASITLPASLLGDSSSSGGGRGDQEMEFGIFFYSFKKCGAEYRITESGESGVFRDTLLQCCLLLGILAPGRCELKI